MRDETAFRCEHCTAVLPPARRGRPRRYCSRGCQAKAYRRRHPASRSPSAPVTPDTGARRPAAGHSRQRRLRIAEAVWRIGAERGLHAASMREVAAEAGVSLRSVQYHFGSKHELLVEALRLLHEDNERRARARIRFDPAAPRALLRGILREFLPLDRDRHRSWRVLTAYYARSLTDPALAAVFHRNDNELEELVAAVIAQAHRDGRAVGGLDPRHEAELLVSCAVGLGGDMLHRRRTEAAAMATLDYHLDKLFPRRAG